MEPKVDFSKFSKVQASLRKGCWQSMMKSSSWLMMSWTWWRQPAEGTAASMILVAHGSSGIRIEGSGVNAGGVIAHSSKAWNQRR